MNKRLEQYKELLQVLPRNNVKNSRVYLKKATLMKQAATIYKDELLKDIKRRYQSIVIEQDNEEIKLLENYLEDMKKNLYLLSDFNDSYEKSNLNVTLYDLKKFYKNDLTKVNQDIQVSIEKFLLVGVKLGPSDFTYGEEVEEYMKLFFQEENPDSENLKASFDKLYWKSPELIEHIYLNFRYLYFSYKKKFEKYYANKLKDVQITDKDKYLKEYQNYLAKYLLLKSSDAKILQDQFLDGTLDIKEYDDAKISKLRESLILKETNQAELDDNFLKLSYTLFEYKNYLRFKKIIEEIKKIHEDKGNKSLTKSILKKISKCEKKIKKMNKKIRFRKRFKGPEAPVAKFYSIIDANLVELKDLYNDYDDAKFKEKISTSLNEESTLLDVLVLAISYKNNLAKILKIDNEDMTDSDILKEERALTEFIFYPNNTIINNITIDDTRDLVTIIFDKYKLMNINVTNEQLEEANLDSVISMVNKILINSYINRSNIKYIDLNSACEMKKILEKEEKEVKE